MTKLSSYTHGSPAPPDRPSCSGPPCPGAGEECRKCGGKGAIEYEFREAMDAYDCPRCYGTGWEVESDPSRCDCSRHPGEA